MESQLREIFAGITEYYDSPLRLGSRCEANTYYRVEDLRFEDLRLCSEYLRERIFNINGSSIMPRYLISLPGSYTGLSELLCKELIDDGAECDLIEFREIEKNPELAEAIRGEQVVLVNDVITTARSCLEAHSKVTILGAQVNCWVCLIDRTFGPGPVPVVATFTGDPVRLLEDVS